MLTKISIARIWGGRTPIELSAAFEEHVRSTGIAEAFAAGASAALLLKRTHESEAYFLLITFWPDFGSIRRFAGDPIDRAVLYPGDDKFELVPDQTVSHYEVSSLTWNS